MTAPTKGQTTTPSGDMYRTARELLAAEYDRDKLTFVADCIRTDAMLSRVEERSLRAVVAALARNAELERLCDATYVAQGADAYSHACETLEIWQKARAATGKDPGCEGSLCDGLSWLQSRIAELEAERDAADARGDRWSLMAQEIDIEVQKMAAERDALAADNLALREVVAAYEVARQEIFDHCLSNGVFNAWGNAMDCTSLNDAHLLARTPAATTKENGND